MYTTTAKAGRASPEVRASIKETTHARFKDIPVQRELLILFALKASGRKGVYGLDIQRSIEECSNGSVTISHGSLYSLLKRLRRKKYIDSYEGNALGGGAKRHYYFLTENGRTLVDSSNTFFGYLQKWTSEQ